MAQFLERLDLYLPDPLPRKVEVFAHLFKRMLGPDADAEPHPDDLLLPLGERRKHLFDTACRLAVLKGLEGRDRFLIHDNVLELFLLGKDRRLEGHRLLDSTEDLGHPRYGKA